MSHDMSMQDVYMLSNYDPRISSLIKRISVQSREKFIEILMTDIEEAISDLQLKRDLFNKKNVNEDLITTYLVSYLTALGYEASHDTKDGGHVDLTVSNYRCKAKWKAEAKIYNSNSYVHGGWRQLTTRYIVGGANDSNAGVLIYCFKTDAAKIFSGWLKHLETEEHVENEISVCQLRANTRASLPATGTLINVRQFMISLYFPTSNHAAA